LCPFIILFFNQTNSLGSVITPRTALAATVRAEARYTPDFLLPILPGKFLFVVEITVSPSTERPNVSVGPPRHAAQLG
jgi:hypothetical protein